MLKPIESQWILNTFKALAAIIITPDPSLMRAVILAVVVSGPKSSIFLR